jgi:hypothetical protein
MWLATWFFQVMPIFFFVGGFSNLTAYDAYRRRGEPTSAFVRSRLVRLLRPSLVVLGIWLVIQVGLHVAVWVGGHAAGRHAPAPGLAAGRHRRAGSSAISWSWSRRPHSSGPRRFDRGADRDAMVAPTSSDSASARTASYRTCPVPLFPHSSASSTRRAIRQPAPARRDGDHRPVGPVSHRIGSGSCPATRASTGSRASGTTRRACSAPMWRPSRTPTRRPCASCSRTSGRSVP